ncbi:MAG: alpha/beta hydrolase [Bdellovibrionota bacterium]
MENFDVADFGSEIIVPTLIIAGKQDRCVPLPNIEYLASKLKNAQIEVIPHGSHCPHLDDPPLVNELISNFIRKKRNAFSKKKNNL